MEKNLSIGFSGESKSADASQSGIFVHTGEPGVFASTTSSDTANRPSTLRPGPPKIKSPCVSASIRSPVIPSRFGSAVNRSYPSTLRNTGRWGNALVSFTVGADGRVERSSISVEQASHPAFRTAATAAISAARFTPARVNGQPVRAQVSMPITWQGGGERDEEE